MTSESPLARSLSKLQTAKAELEKIDKMIVDEMNETGAKLRLLLINVDDEALVRGLTRLMFRPSPVLVGERGRIRGVIEKLLDKINANGYSGSLRNFYEVPDDGVLRRGRRGPGSYQMKHSVRLRVAEGAASDVRIIEASEYEASRFE